MFEKLSSISLLQLIRHKSIQNFIFLLFIQSSNILISLMAMPLLIQSIGVDQFGLVSLALSVILIANMFVGYGYNLSAPREVALNQNDNEALSEIVSRTILSKMLLACVASLALLIAVYGLDLFSEYQVILVYSLLMLFSEATLPVWFFQGIERMRLVSVANVFSKLLYLMGIVLFIVGPEQAKLVNFFFGGAALATNLVILIYVHFVMDIQFFIPKLRKIVQSWKANVYLFLSTLASHISVSGGIVILSFFASAKILGMYSLAERVSSVLRIIPALIAQAVYPHATKLYKNDQKKFFAYVKKVYLFSILSCFVISLLTYFLADFIIEILSKESLETSVSFLRVLCFIPFLASMNIGNSLLMLVSDYKSLLFNSSWVMCLSMLTFSLIGIELFGGIGLCYGIIISEALVFIYSSVLIMRKAPNLFYGLVRSN
ncbi:oligosaccharide flippase family protein [Echinicola salinicaeni]|uniref:oligosaccharide flippase family protein n=1 Tax=Echinicola salinicaeni TaxID=2762757 RepID=UPI00164544B0|nr:oligosaccharide flippase family protein [Echinicola salinicaeni]